MNGQIAYESPSVHNKSGDPLLQHSNEMATSPSTSITDISSTNCTPQHIGTNEALSKGALGVRPTAEHFNMNSIGRSKATTTFGPNNGLYSTVKTCSDTLKTFGEAAKQKHSQQSPLRKIEENNYESVIRPMAPSADPANVITRTMERRHVKNSEI